VGFNCVLNYGGYVDGQQYESHCPKTARIDFLCGVYIVLLSCVHLNLLQLKFAQGIYAHPVHDFAPPPRCKCYVCSSWNLYSLDWRLVNGVSGQSIGAIFTCQHCLTLEHGTDSLIRNIVK